MSKNVYIDELDDIVNKYNITCHKAIKMKPVDAKSKAYINSSKETNVKAPKFKAGDIVRIPEYKNFFAKAMFQIGLRTFFWLKKLEIQCVGYMLLVILKVNKLLEYFTKKNSRVEKVIKRKGDKLYVKWKGYDNSFKSWIDKKDINE